MQENRRNDKIINKYERKFSLKGDMVIMKLSKTMKKAIAYICAVAMVVGSLTIYKASSIKAADDYSNLDYTGTVANDGGINYDNLKGSTWALLENSTSIQEYSFNVFQYQEGNTLYVTAHTDVGLVGKINGIEGEKQQPR